MYEPVMVRMCISAAGREMFVERLWKEKETSAFWKNKTNYLFSKTFSIYSYPKKPSGTPRGLVHNLIPTQSSLFQKKKKHYNPESFCHPLFPPSPFPLLIPLRPPTPPLIPPQHKLQPPQIRLQIPRHAPPGHPLLHQSPVPDLPFVTQHPQHPFAGAVIQFRVVGERFGHVEDVGAFGCGQECLGAEFLVEAEDVVDGDAEEGVEEVWMGEMEAMSVGVRCRAWEKRMTAATKLEMGRRG